MEDEPKAKEWRWKDSAMPPKVQKWIKWAPISLIIAILSLVIGVVSLVLGIISLSQR